MWIIKRTGELFANRKELKAYVGQYNFRKLLRSGEIYFINPDLLNKIKEYTVLKNETLSIQ